MGVGAGKAKALWATCTLQRTPLPAGPRKTPRWAAPPPSPPTSQGPRSACELRARDSPEGTMELSAGRTRPSSPTGNSIMLEGTASEKAWRQARGAGPARGAGKSDPRSGDGSAGPASQAQHLIPTHQGGPRALSRGPGLAARGRWTWTQQRPPGSGGGTCRRGAQAPGAPSDHGDRLEGPFPCPPHRPLVSTAQG